MRKILSFLNETGYSRYNKQQLMSRLTEVEKDGRISDEQKNAINTWFGSGYKGVISDYYRLDAPQGIKRKRGRHPAQEQKISGNGMDDAGDEPIEHCRELYECSICAAELGSASFPRQISAECMHEPTCCTACLSRDLKVQIENKPWDKIECPECPVTLSYENVKAFAAADDFIRYDENSLLSFISRDPNFTNCLGPGCEDGQIHEGGDDQPIMTCRTCGFKTCFAHKMPWHSGLTCRDYDAQQEKQRGEQEKASRTYLKKKSTDCPKCGAHVSKTQGCDHMRCKCGADFCYSCGVDYKVLKGNNAGHDPRCPHHSANLPPYPYLARGATPYVGRVIGDFV
ncbi:hypothetical protein DSL72_006528 [Monilinia vaccinii-corymbosi]|uniref:RBR-type E3 ubiquitin transferase n=1 Tax=Monilinia vaccinii-corymbosi TaxID=61207 RepID=A0A8A3PMG1_9HELO|nr:hypothetical protein DSL72_006528 [Monilinia vaccinii-corymbosi]